MFWALGLVRPNTFSDLLTAAELLQIPFPEEKFLSFKQTDTIGAIGPGQGGAIRYTRKVMTGDLENALHGCDTEARKMSRR